ncbi:DUF1259 domain-containing protein [Bacillus sp. FJAT-27251]|uniref:DUF1259 domain-containing protein n=1 Tax=Bacillus sp. FJAT-27251 TaxID=1684142 RepID=UPI0006A7622C|nr:DUF1259 domain-containing protein [Bacillus sp. FJAT-27251]
MNDFHHVCSQFGKILNGKTTVKNGACQVSIDRKMNVTVQGKLSHTVMPIELVFESIDEKGIALNLAEIAILEHEIPRFMHSVVQGGMIVSALHNHWLFTSPNIMYLHVQSVEPPLDFARKMAYSLSFLEKASN